jgi:hypothetical protein
MWERPTLCAGDVLLRIKFFDLFWIIAECFIHFQEENNDFPSFQVLYT